MVAPEDQNRGMATDGDCLACGLASGRTTLPGGRVHETDHWVVEPSIGPLPVGTLVVKPIRHRVSVGALTDQEAQELGPLLRDVSVMVHTLTNCDQVYVCLWSHADWTPGHIHFVVQPAWDSQKAEHRRPGPFLQVDLFGAGHHPAPGEVDAFAAAAREAFQGRTTS